jgi:hypothetical protein
VVISVVICEYCFEKNLKKYDFKIQNGIFMQMATQKQNLEKKYHYAMVIKTLVCM